jgi:hypothetical protein
MPVLKNQKSIGNFFLDIQPEKFDIQCFPKLLCRKYYRTNTVVLHSLPWPVPLSALILHLL